LAANRIAELKGLASDIVVKKGGPICEVPTYYRSKTDTPGVLQRLEFIEQDYFAVSTCCELRVVRPKTSEWFCLDQGKNAAFGRSRSLRSPNDM
jgi:hypothetical protein